MICYLFPILGFAFTYVYKIHYDDGCELHRIQIVALAFILFNVGFQYDAYT